jgi:hypothetical protein
MEPHFIVQASGAMFDTISPEGWTYVFGVFVTDEEGTPVEGLKKRSFSVWELTTVGERDIRLVMELNADFPTSKMPGIYRIQTTQMLGIQAPAPQEFVFAIRVSSGREKKLRQGMTTVPITYLGKAH